uniref:Uncharacterized protein LOC108043222 n=1 Tax=Drosophila rhopaloa TaxID=1041015 RepID=A0A6P4EGJ6_DRORH
MSTNLKLFFQLIVLLFLFKQNVSEFEFTNIKCICLDEQFSSIEYCLLKSVNRSYKYISLKVNLFKAPVTKVNMVLHKRFNGYRPFLYNFTVDACRFLKNPAANPIANYFYGFLTVHTNVNHTCPFNTPIIFDKLSSNFVDHRITHVLPFPEGDYLLETNVYVNEVNRVVLKVYGSLS